MAQHGGDDKETQEVAVYEEGEDIYLQQQNYKILLNLLS